MSKLIAYLKSLFDPYPVWGDWLKTEGHSHTPGHMYKLGLQVVAVRIRSDGVQEYIVGKAD